MSKNPAYAFFSTVPFGPNFGEFIAWQRYGGAEQMHDEMLAPAGVKQLLCGVLPPEASGWFRKPIEKIEDLRGLKMRFFGLGARVMEKFGVSTQLLAPGDIYPALELGTIDATELSLPQIDEGLGFYQVAKHYYFPGWHQQVTFANLLVNKANYDGLNDSHKAQLGAMCNEQIVNNMAEGEANQYQALARIQAKGVTLHTWPDSILERFRTAWFEVIEEEAAKDATMKKIWESYSTFRRNYAIWRERGYLKE